MRKIKSPYRMNNDEKIDRKKVTRRIHEKFCSERIPVFLVLQEFTIHIFTNDV